MLLGHQLLLQTFALEAALIRVLGEASSPGRSQGTLPAFIGLRASHRSMVDTAPAFVHLPATNGEAVAAPADKAGVPPAPDHAPQQDGPAAMMVDGALPNGSAGVCASRWPNVMKRFIMSQ